MSEAQGDLITELEKFVERGQTAQRHIDNILQRSDREARRRPRARGTDPQTSHKAAKRAAADLTAKQVAVLDCFKGSEGLTDPEFIHKYNLRREYTPQEYPYPAQSPSGLRTRRHELVVKGKVESTGVKADKHTIWRLKRENT